MLPTTPDTLYAYFLTLPEDSEELPAVEAKYLELAKETIWARAFREGVIWKLVGE